MDKIPSTMVLQRHADGVDTMFSTMSVPLVKTLLGEWLGVIIRGSYQAASKDSRWAHECDHIYIWIVTLVLMGKVMR